MKNDNPNPELSKTWLGVDYGTSKDASYQQLRAEIFNLQQRFSDPVIVGLQEDALFLKNQIDNQLKLGSEAIAKVRELEIAVENLEYERDDLKFWMEKLCAQYQQDRLDEIALTPASKIPVEAIKLGAKAWMLNTVLDYMKTHTKHSLGPIRTAVVIENLREEVENLKAHLADRDCTIRYVKQDFARAADERDFQHHENQILVKRANELEVLYQVARNGLAEVCRTRQFEAADETLKRLDSK